MTPRRRPIFGPAPANFPFVKRASRTRQLASIYTRRIADVIAPACAPPSDRSIQRDDDDDDDTKRVPAIELPVPDRGPASCPPARPAVRSLARRRADLLRSDVNTSLATCVRACSDRPRLRSATRRRRGPPAYTRSANQPIKDRPSSIVDECSNREQFGRCRSPRRAAPSSSSAAAAAAAV